MNDEFAHEPGDEPDWAEAWWFDFVDEAERVGGFVRLCTYPNQGRTTFWAAFVGRPRAPVLVIEDDMPAPGRSLELRTSGLWTEIVIEEPFEHVSVGLEAFGVALDDPEDAYSGMRGIRTPLGFDLGWEANAEPVSGDFGYLVDADVHGEVLVGPDEYRIDGRGRWHHLWGLIEKWDQPWSLTSAFQPFVAEEHDQVGWAPVPIGDRARLLLSLASGPLGLAWAAESRPLE